MTDDRSASSRAHRQSLRLQEYCITQNTKVTRARCTYSRLPPCSDTQPTLYVITPTYSRPVQKAELTRLSNTLLHVPNLHWLVVEDSARKTALVSRLLGNSGLNYTHLNVETLRNVKVRTSTKGSRIPRGTVQRNLALRWLRSTISPNSGHKGVVYFADDDNTYSLELFEEVRLKLLNSYNLVLI